MQTVARSSAHRRPVVPHKSRPGQIPDVSSPAGGAAARRANGETISGIRPTTSQLSFYMDYVLLLMLIGLFGVLLGVTLARISS
jgi:hypothetical protein